MKEEKKIQTGHTHKCIEFKYKLEHFFSTTSQRLTSKLNLDAYKTHYTDYTEFIAIHAQ